MNKKLRKARLHPRDRRSREHAAWMRNVGEGMRRAKLARRAAGLLTPVEVGVELGLSRRSVAEIFTLVAAGPRKHIRRVDVEQWKTGSSASAA
jgi:hypothetical protein